MKIAIQSVGAPANHLHSLMSLTPFFRLPQRLVISTCSKLRSNSRSSWLKCDGKRTWHKNRKTALLAIAKFDHTNQSENGVYSSLFRAKASGAHSKTWETRDAQFLQKVTRFALIGVGPARPRVCKCPPPQIPVSQSPFNE